MGIGRGLPLLLQVRPRLVLLGPVPILSYSGFAEEDGFGSRRGRLIVQDGDERAAGRAGTDRLQQPNVALFVDYRFDRASHVLTSGQSFRLAFAPGARQAWGYSVSLHWTGDAASMKGSDRCNFEHSNWRERTRAGAAPSSPLGPSAGSSRRHVEPRRERPLQGRGASIGPSTGGRSRLGSSPVAVGRRHGDGRKRRPIVGVACATSRPASACSRQNEPGGHHASGERSHLAFGVEEGVERLLGPLPLPRPPSQPPGRQVGEVLGAAATPSYPRAQRARVSTSS